MRATTNKISHIISGSNHILIICVKISILVSYYVVSVDITFLACELKLKFSILQICVKKKKQRNQGFYLQQGASHLQIFEPMVSFVISCTITTKSPKNVRSVSLNTYKVLVHFSKLLQVHNMGSTWRIYRILFSLFPSWLGKTVFYKRSFFSWDSPNSIANSGNSSQIGGNSLQSRTIFTIDIQMKWNFTIDYYRTIDKWMQTKNYQSHKPLISSWYLFRRNCKK